MDYRNRRVDGNGTDCRIFAWLRTFSDSAPQHPHSSSVSGGGPRTELHAHALGLCRACAGNLKSDHRYASAVVAQLIPIDRVDVISLERLRGGRMLAIGPARADAVGHQTLNPRVRDLLGR